MAAECRLVLISLVGERSQKSADRLAKRTAQYLEALSLFATDGLKFLAEEAFQCFGKRSQEYRHTFALWKLRKYGEISMNLGTILQKVDSLRMLKETAWPA